MKNNPIYFNNELSVVINPIIEKPTYDYVSFKRLVTTATVGNTLNLVQTTQKTGFVAAGVVLPILTIALFTQGIVQRKLKK